MPSVTGLLRRHIAQIEEYTPTTSLRAFSSRLGIPAEQLIKLDANENPYGPSPQALAAIAGDPGYSIYPDPDQSELRAALSGFTGQPAGRILAGNGADELIDMLLRAFLDPGEVILNCPPTFGMYSLDAAICAGRVVDVPRSAEFGIDSTAIAEAAEREQAKLLFLASPNNPDGSRTPLAQIRELLELPLLVVIDEAYVEFCGGSIVELIDQYPNLAVLRTFSKWAGLAGLRVGYGVMHEEVAVALWKIKQPYNLNVAAEAAAVASLADQEYLLGNVARIVAERGRLALLLAELPWLHVYPSEANYLLCRVRDRSAAEVKDALARRGILVRHYRKAGLSDCVRLSVGRPAQNDALVAALHEV